MEVVFRNFKYKLFFLFSGSRVENIMKLRLKRFICINEIQIFFKIQNKDIFMNREFR